MLTQDYIINQGGGFHGHGAVGQQLASSRCDPNLYRPFYETDPKSPRYGQRCVFVNSGRMRYSEKYKKPIPEKLKLTLNEAHRMGMNLPMVVNATSLRKEEWIELDKQVLEASRYQLQAWADLVGIGAYSGFNGMGKMVLEHETMSDPGEAVVDMDGLTVGRTDAPKFQLEGLPLPIIHSDFWFSQRRLEISRGSGMPLDTAMGGAASRRVSEHVEKLTIGNVTGPIYGGNSSQVGGYGRTSQVYGYTNFPTRITKTNLTTPTGSNASSTIDDVLAMRQSLYNNKFKGPFMLYHSNDWDRYLDNDYTLSGGNVTTKTLRNRLREIDGIVDVRRLDMLFATPPQTNPMWTTTTVNQGGSAGTGLTGISPYKGPGGEGVSSTGNPYTLLMVQMTPEVARAVIGMNLTVVQWESQGGMRVDFKVMAIMVPQLRADIYGNCGILHASTS